MAKHRENRDFTYRSLREERKYGLYWYNWIWSALRPLLVLTCSLLVTVGLVLLVWNGVNTRYIAPVNPQDTGDVVFSVESGNSLTRVSRNLEKAGLIRNSSVFKYYADFLGYGQKIQAGEYVLNRSMTLGEIAEHLAAGDGTPIVRDITIIEGWTAADIAKYLYKEGAIASEEEFLSLCRDGNAFSAYYYIADVLAKNNTNRRLFALEGYLAPDTYEVYTSATAADIIKKLLSQTEAVYKEAYHDRASEMGMTMDEVITLASLIEKEAKTGDFQRVSAVFHNRLKTGMNLGSDVTVKYVTGIRRMSLTSSDLSVNSPYNTYLYSGLPIGPICNPSADAIYAALYPDESFLADGYLYFCSKDPDTGELFFSKTLAEHEAAVKIYQPLWQAYDEATGAQ